MRIDVGREAAETRLGRGCRTERPPAEPTTLRA